MSLKIRIIFFSGVRSVQTLVSLLMPPSVNAMPNPTIVGQSKHSRLGNPLDLPAHQVGFACGYSDQRRRLVDQDA